MIDIETGGSIGQVVRWAENLLAFSESGYGQLVLNAGLLVLAALALLLWFGLMRSFKFLAKRTFTKLDDILLYAVRAPVAWLLVLAALCQVADNLLRFFLGSSVVGLATLLPYLSLFAVVWIFVRFIHELEEQTIKQEHSILPQALQERVKLDKHSFRLLVFVLRASIIIIIVLTLLSMLGVSLAGILAFGGLGGIVIGLALKDPIANFFAGALLFWERPFVVGDWVRCPAANIEGVVVNINWRTTLIKTFDRRPIYVPNAVFVNNYIENAQRMTNRRMYEKAGVRYEDIDKLPALLDDIRAMVKQHPGVDDSQAMVVAFDNYGDFSLNFFICCITYATSWEEFQMVKQDILLRTAGLVAKHGASFAYPTSRVKLEHTPQDSPNEAEAS